MSKKYKLKLVKSPEIASKYYTLDKEYVIWKDPEWGYWTWGKLNKETQRYAITDSKEYKTRSQCETTIIFEIEEQEADLALWEE